MDVYRQNDGVTELIQRHFLLLYYLHLSVDSQNVYSNITLRRGSRTTSYSGDLGGLL
jgi:hypothetical protein